MTLGFNWHCRNGYASKHDTVYLPWSPAAIWQESDWGRCVATHNIQLSAMNCYLGLLARFTHPYITPFIWIKNNGHALKWRGKQYEAITFKSNTSLFNVFGILLHNHNTSCMTFLKKKRDKNTSIIIHKAHFQNVDIP